MGWFFLLMRPKHLIYSMIIMIINIDYWLYRCHDDLIKFQISEMKSLTFFFGSTTFKAAILLSMSDTCREKGHFTDYDVIIVSSRCVCVTPPTSLSVLWTLAAVSAITSSSSDSSESVVPPKWFLALCSRRLSFDSNSKDWPAAMYTCTGKTHK